MGVTVGVGVGVTVGLMVGVTVGLMVGVTVGTVGEGAGFEVVVTRHSEMPAVPDCSQPMRMRM